MCHQPSSGILKIPVAVAAEMLACLVIAACHGGDFDARDKLTQVGVLGDARLDEASGLATSCRDPSVLWHVNDSGGPRLYATGIDGRDLGRTDVDGAQHRDWEDLAAFELDGSCYLAIGDIGDNEARRDRVQVYVVREPDPGTQSVSVAWTVDFDYPDGPRDAESLLVDADAEELFVLSKRDVPPKLFAVPLRPRGAGTAELRRTGVGLPLPTKVERTVAAESNGWYWQPTAIDLSRDGRQIAVLTYSAIHVFGREPGDALVAAFDRPWLRVATAPIAGAESVAFGAGGDRLYLSIEQKNAPLYELELAPRSDPDKPSVTLMTFNVENLFDNQDDPRRNDETYLPIAAKQNDAHRAGCASIEVERWRNECLELDWSDAVVDYKLATVAAAIRAVNAGRGADVIALQEVENVEILERLRSEHLGDLGYRPAVLIEGQDRRGIDVAFLSKLPLAGEPVLHPVAFPDFADREGDTRGILRADFELPDGTILTGFAVHFPAPFHPTAMREIAYAALNEHLAALPPDRPAFAAGDFNTTSAEDAREDMLDRLARPHWVVAHDLGCGDCPGTQYYARDDAWSFLDMLLYSPSRDGSARWQIREDSVRVANRTAAQRSDADTPRRFDPLALAGVSDHWPLAVDIEPADRSP